MADCEPIPHQFMDLRVPEYAYMFGFLQADGHLSQQSRQRGRLTVEINARDIELLGKFQKLTPYNSSISERTRSTNFSKTAHSAVWSLCSLEARTKLNGLGLPYGRKSKTISPPLGEFSQRDYIRGVIDADGSVGCTSKGFPFVSLTTASTAIAAYLCQYAQEVTGAERNFKRNTRDAIYNILYTKENAQKLAAHLYYSGCLSLERKQSAADSLSAWTRPAGMKVMSHRRWKVWEDRVLLEHNNAEPAAEALDRTVQSCSLRLWRLRTGQVPMPANDQ
ncbi:LAGLIDADG family homing endonuclease [Streptomyces sp. NBC_01485]|uniref:LAGLIDADG family homing endonuclease n=1 Tax=Streptomyces sp. NBC_01485 TaxID=2903884 RepID=UPI002E37A9F9|nr:LAGLIDADG family homing endonuclease [Streptomyces sp. NBC_01485]